MVRSDGSTKFVDNFAPNGARESSVALERPPVPFFPSQLAVFPSGEILISGMQYHPGYKASTAIFDATGHLIKQPVVDGDAALERAISQDTGAQHRNISAIDTSVATTGDDGLVYLMRATSPVTVYAICSAGEVVRQIVVRTPSIHASPDFGIRVAQNRLAIQFRQSCGDTSGSCRSSAYTVVAAATGKQLATYEAEKEAAGPMVCFVPNPDRFLILHGSDIIEAEPK